ncbi:hypothetical protein K6W16_15670 [Burkholderia dolosa]|uniref:Uncharacterized protein n=1 Tax=Burkholderia dolosa TaxID=152500 RepID=A0A892I7K6_9BURK|nr:MULTISPECIES: hypothetical protein [Burkholderia]MBR8420266.1 hypothetical protein [Burkholderia dolosa]MBY4658776.1 hypothetical protein [Burkholderia dolosa]MBY4689437.1 hypothetical protein [Burkholderia dolosa]MBY4780776.1 hypothetical protein [Burkholderia dolosa]MBY4787364.1 hypothetical protein [Burkholderia dolosa]
MKRSSRAAVSIVAPFFCVRPVARDDLRFMLRAGRLPFDQGRVGMTDATRQIQMPISDRDIRRISVSFQYRFTEYSRRAPLRPTQAGRIRSADPISRAIKNGRQMQRKV